MQEDDGGAWLMYTYKVGGSQTTERGGGRAARQRSRNSGFGSARHCTAWQRPETAAARPPTPGHRWRHAQ